MKNVAPREDDSYYFNYCHAAWIEPHKTAGLFMSLMVGGSDDEIVMLNVERSIAPDTDAAIIGIKRGADTTPKLRSMMMSSFAPGSSGDTLNRFLKVQVVDIDHNQEVLCDLTIMYGQNALIPNPAPMDFYYYDYVAAPYATYTNGLGHDSVYIIVSLSLREGDEVTGETYSPTAESGKPDSFVLHINATGTEQNKVAFTHVYGPYTLGADSTNGVELATSVNGGNPQRPIGIKSYGNGEGNFMGLTRQEGAQV